MNLIEAFRLQTLEFQNNYHRLIKPGIIFIVLLISAAFGFRATHQMAIYFFLVAAAITVAIIYLLKPSLGIIIMVPASLLIPSPFGSAFGGFLNTTILLVTFFTGIWFIDMLVRQRQVKLVSSKAMRPALALVVVSIIAFLNGQLLYTTLARTAPIQTQIGGVGVYILSIAAFVLIANQIQDLIWLKRMTWIFLTLGGIYIIFGRLLPLGISYPVRALFQYGSDASIFWIWLVAMASSQSFYNKNLGKSWRILLFLFVLATFYVSLSQAYGWKSGWLPPAISLITIIFIGMKRYRLLLLIVVFIAIVFNFSNLSSVFTGEEDLSIFTRLPAWEIVLEIFKLNPLLGVGIANYYWYTPNFHILGYTGWNFSSHNNYLDILAQMGIIGLLCFLWFFWETGRLGWQLKDKVPKGFTYSYVIGALGGIVGTLSSGMLGDWIIPFVYNISLHGFRSALFAWLFMGGLAVLEQIYIVKEINQDI